jgi:hypothetical protein
MQFKVPQNVQREDTIIGSITIKQMIIVIIGGGIDYMIYIGFSQRGFSSVFWFPPVLIIGLLTVAIAFVKINNLSFSKYIMLFLERLINPQKRLWRKGAAEVYKGIFAPKNVQTKKTDVKAAKEKKSIEKKQTALSNISRLSQVLDTQGHENEVEHPIIDQTDDKSLLHTAFNTGKTGNEMDNHLERLTKIQARPSNEILPVKKTPPAPAETKEVKVVEQKKEVTTIPEKKKSIESAMTDMQPAEKTKDPELKSGEIKLNEGSGTISLGTNK